MKSAGLVRPVLAQTRVELLLATRRGESILVTIVIPPVLLWFLSFLGPLPAAAEPPIDFLVPGIVALAVISTSMVSLGIATAFERYYGVLKRLGSTPLPRGGLLAAKMLSVLAIEVLQVALILGIAAGWLGWSPARPWWSILPALLLGTVTFAALGLLLAGTLRAEATLAAANGLYVLFLLVGGIAIPVSALPGWLEPIAAALPAHALAEALRAGLNGGAPAIPLAQLAGWAGLGSIAAGRWFRWE